MALNGKVRFAAEMRARTVADVNAPQRPATASTTAKRGAVRALYDASINGTICAARVVANARVSEGDTAVSSTPAIYDKGAA
jgi:hypothetical protein